MARILFTGGGTLGSVTPLIAIWEECGRTEDAALWIGTYTGVERAFVERSGIPYRAIYGGKLRRYFSLRNFFDPFLLLVGVFQSIIHILYFNPDIIINAGSFIGVPVIFAGSILGKKCLLVQLDVEPSLSNIMTQAFVDHIAIACEPTAEVFNKKKTLIVGVPVRKEMRAVAELVQNDASKIQLRKDIGIHDDAPMVLVLGGGTGSTAINSLVWNSLPLLTSHLHVFHVTGKGKESPAMIHNPRYHYFSLVTDELSTFLACADVVISRAGLGTLAELSCFGKATILIPIPRSHQEKNALYAEKKGAARYCDQEKLTPELLVSEVDRLISRPDERALYEEGMRALFPADAERRMCALIRDVTTKKK